MRSHLRLAAVFVCWAAVGMANGAFDASGDALPPRAKLRIGTTRFRHGDSVTCAAFAADGRTAATASRDRTVSLWELKSGRELVRCQGHTGPVLAAAFTADGKHLVTGSADGTVRLWRLPRSGAGTVAGEEVRCLRLSSADVQAVAFAPGAATVAAGNVNGVISVWDIAAGRERYQLSDEGQVFALALSGDGTLVAANHAASGLALWDVKKGKKVHLLGDGVVASLAFAPDGRSLAAGYHDNRLILWDSRTKEVLRTLAGHERQGPGQFNGVLSVSFSGDGRRLASGGTDNAVRVWDVETGRQSSEATGHQGWVTAVAFSPDGKHLISGSADNTVQRWESATGRRLSPLHEPAAPLTAVSLASDGRALATIAADDRLALWSGDGRMQPLPAALAAGRALAASFAPEERTLAVATMDGRLRFVDLTGKTARTTERESPRQMDRLVWSRDGRRAATYGPDHHVDIWNAAAGELLHHIGLQEEDRLAMAFDRQGRQLATASEADTIRVWDGQTGLEQRPITGSFAGALALSFSADGRTLHAAGRDGRVRLWELTTRQSWRVYPTEETGLTAAAFTADGQVLATGGADGSVRLWDATTGKARLVLRRHRGPITMLAFASQAPLLASASRDTTVLLWDLSGLPPSKTPPPLDLSVREIDTLWEKLAGDAPAAYEALHTLRRAPGQVVPYLRARLRPVQGDFRPLLADLDSDDYKVRARAAEQLSRFGRVAERAMRRALENRPSLEVRRRLEELLAELGDGPDLVLATPREARCVELLERLGSTEAHRVLQTLANGLAEAELTQQAKASLARLARRSPP
jgi:WD40 repeat protein